MRPQAAGPKQKTNLREGPLGEHHEQARFANTTISSDDQFPTHVRLQREREKTRGTVSFSLSPIAGWVPWW